MQPIKYVKINKEMFGHPDTVSGWPYIVRFFVNFAVFKWLYLA